MPRINVITLQKEKIAEIDLSDSVFDADIKPHIMHSVVVWQLAKRRRGTASTKDRSKLTYSTSKLYRQKGTGRARAGSKRSPLRVGGGIIFGPTPRSYATSLPKKVRKMALKFALTQALREGKLTVLDSFPMEAIKTKEFISRFSGLQLPKALIVIDGKDENLEKSARNVPGVKILRAAGLNVYDILYYQNLVLMQSSIPLIEGALQS
ncbi:MAG: 50S ribosomal protein L4 [Deltaproteobacteria bacterium]|nr:50S ribosomal protein L4 [Deltaproteobacteria bacterium]